MPESVLARGWTRPTSFTGRAPDVPAEQLALFPRKTVIELGVPDGKDIYRYVQADDGRRYYLKLDQGDKPVRANEWLSHRLASVVGVSTPRCQFIQTVSGDIAFGSEAVDGASRLMETVLYLETSSLNELGMPAPGLQAQLSAVHALDLFVCNTDRHIGNFVVVPNGNDRSLLAIDFARSLFWRWPWNGFLAADDMSSLAWAELRQRHGFDLNAASAVVRRLGIITPGEIEVMLSQMPSHWLSSADQNEFLDYCRSGRWAARVAQLLEGLGNGSIV